MFNGEKPLSDTRILEFGHIVAGPFCSLLLADLGAEVIKIERPGVGEIFRRGSESSNSTFNCMNRSKKSLTINLKSSEGKDIIRELVTTTDAIIENFSPGTLDGLELGYGDLTEYNPELIYCSIKGFTDGPYQNRPALDPVAEALTGLMSRTGYPNQPPARCGASIADMTASFHAALAIVGAIRQRDHTNEGQRITSPLFESTATLMGPALAHADAYDEVLGPMGGGGYGGGTWSPYGVFQTSDEKWVFLGPSSQKHWIELCNVLDLDLVDDDRFETLAKRRENQRELHSILDDIISTYSRPEFLAVFEGEEVPIAPVNNTKEAVNDPHLNQTSLVEITTAEGEHQTIRVPGNPIESSAYDSKQTADPPTLGEHTDTILRDLGYSTEELNRFEENEII